MKTITLVVDGTPEGRLAAEVAIMLAQKLNAKIVAQYVVDPKEIFALEDFDKPGLCGSGPFVEAEQRIASALLSLGETLLMSFTALAEGHEVTLETFADRGDPVQEIIRRSENSSLIVLSSGAKKQTLASALREVSSCPIVVVDALSSNYPLLEPAVAAPLAAAQASS